MRPTFNSKERRTLTTYDLRRNTCTYTPASTACDDTSGHAIVWQLRWLHTSQMFSKRELWSSVVYVTSTIKVQADTVFSNKSLHHTFQKACKGFSLIKSAQLAALGHFMPHAPLMIIILHIFFPCNFPPRACVVMEHLKLPTLLIVRDYDYLSSWLHLLSTSRVFSAPAGCLIETKCFSAGETLQPSMLFWTIRHSNWQIWLRVSKQIFKFPPWL